MRHSFILVAAASVAAIIAAEPASAASCVYHGVRYRNCQRDRSPQVVHHYHHQVVHHYYHYDAPQYQQPQYQQQPLISVPWGSGNGGGYYHHHHDEDDEE